EVDGDGVREERPFGEHSRHKSNYNDDDTGFGVVEEGGGAAGVPRALSGSLLLGDLTMERRKGLEIRAVVDGL
ncbi:hypothetical protein GW17_00028484, partial [Ensete ventricosum]